MACEIRGGGAYNMQNDFEVHLGTHHVQLVAISEIQAVATTANNTAAAGCCVVC